MNRIVWTDRGMGAHRSIKKFEYAKEHTVAPDFGSLKPGEHAQHETKTRDTDNDRITFSNGFTVEEHSYESGLDESGVLHLKSPQGETELVDRSFSYIHTNDRSEELEPMVISRVETYPGNIVEWEQTFPKEGGMRFRPEAGSDRFTMPTFNISPEGDLSASLYSQVSGGNPVEARVEGQALVAKSGDFEFGIAPPIPAEWFLV